MIGLLAGPRSRDRPENAASIIPFIGMKTSVENILMA